MRNWRKHLVVLIAYTLIAVAMTYPLVLHLASAIPGVEGDSTSFLWALGWAKSALVDLHVNPLRTDYVFYPLGGATQLMWAVSLIGLASIPLQSVFGLITTYNLLYFAATVLTAYGMFLLADYVLRATEDGRRKTEFDPRPLPPFQTLLVVQFVMQSRRRAPRLSPLAPFVAGLVFAFAPLRLGYGLAFLNLFNTQFIPFFVLFLIRATRERSWRNAVIAGIFFGLNAYIDFQIAAFLALFALIYAAYVVVSDWRAARASIARWAVAALVAVVIAAPMLAILQQDFNAEGGNYIGVFPIKYSLDRSYDLASYFVPNARSAIYANAPIKIAGINAPIKPGDVTPLNPDAQSFVGYIALLLAAYAAVRRWRTARFWLLAAVLFALFGLGPSLHVLGRDTGIPLPYLALHEIPIVNNIRIPMRYGIMVSFALAMLAAIAIDDLQKRGARSAERGAKIVLRFALLLLPIAILLEYAALPYPIQPLSVPPIYNDLARMPGGFTILEIPTYNWRGASALEWYQAIGEKRILRAYTNRIAPGLAEYFGSRGIPIVDRSMRALEGYDPPLAPTDLAEDKQVRDQVIQFYDLRYAILHRLYLKPEQVSSIDYYLREVLGARRISDDGETMVYEMPRVTAPGGALHIDLRENIGQMYAGRGWQFEYPKANYEGKFDFVWTRGAFSEIYFVADHARDRVMTLNAYAVSPQRVRVSLNGERIGEVTLTPKWKDYSITLPARALKSNMNVVRLEYGAALTETIGVTTITIE
jgi:hypothetical protein